MNLIANVVLLILVIIFIYHLTRGALYVPTHPDKVKTIIALAQIKPGDRFLDLGSGDGRIVIAAARAGADAYGYEINPLLVWWSRRQIRRAGLETQAKVLWKSFWNVNLGSYDTVIIFGIDYIMRRLANKLKTELRPGARFISYAFPLPGRDHDQKIEGLYVYTHENFS